MDQCTIAGTEVFHKRCVANVGNSAGHRLQRHINELQQALEQARRATLDAQRRADDVVTRAEAAIAQANVEVMQATASRDLAAEQHAMLRERMMREIGRQQDIWKADRQRLDGDIARLRVERDTARTELALHQHPSGSDTEEERDPTSVRFSLLELDQLPD